MTLSLSTAILLALAALFMVSREVILSPDTDEFPCASAVVRSAMLLCAAALFWLAVKFYINAGEYGGPASGPIAGTALVIAVYNFIMVMNLWGQRKGRPVVSAIKRARKKKAVSV